ncbi:MAG: DUF6348 family protein [Propionibacteriaceae bacterium]|nr:DUF6348 family protein [Propionibacteriaceae bacterium]
MSDGVLTIRQKADLVAEIMTAATSDPWVVGESGLVRGPGTLGVAVVPFLDEPSNHIDLEFILNVDRREETTLFDCVAGIGKTAQDAIRWALNLWIETTGAAVFELLHGTGEEADHFSGDDPHGFPGWHMVGSPILGYGIGDSPTAVRDWMSDACPWHDLAPLIVPSLTRPMLNGVKFFADSSGTAEVRVNGVVNDAASEALIAMSPRTPQWAAARTYLLLVHPDSQELS